MSVLRPRNPINKKTKQLPGRIPLYAERFAADREIVGLSASYLEDDNSFSVSSLPVSTPPWGRLWPDLQSLRNERIVLLASNCEWRNRLLPRKLWLLGGLPGRPRSFHCAAAIARWKVKPFTTLFSCRLLIRNTT